MFAEIVFVAGLSPCFQGKVSPYSHIAKCSQCNINVNIHWIYVKEDFIPERWSPNRNVRMLLRVIIRSRELKFICINESYVNMTLVARELFYKSN